MFSNNGLTGPENGPNSQEFQAWFAGEPKTLWCRGIREMLLFNGLFLISLGGRIAGAGKSFLSYVQDF